MTLRKATRRNALTVGSQERRKHKRKKIEMKGGRGRGRLEFYPEPGKHRPFYQTDGPEVLSGSLSTKKTTPLVRRI